MASPLRKKRVDEPTLKKASSPNPGTSTASSASLVRLIFMFLVPPVLKMSRSIPDNWKVYAQRPYCPVPSSGTNVWPRTLLTSANVSRVQALLELAVEGFDVGVASGATVGAETGALTAGTVGFAFGRAACAHPASRLAPSRMTTVRNVPNFFIFLSFRNGYCN